MAKIIERFWDDENGNAVIDWIVLASGVLMLSTAIFATLAPGETQDLAGDVEPVIVTARDA